MKTPIVKRYTSEDRILWNKFVEESKNATFLFHRDFMEYHSERFEDYSLLVFEDTVLIAVLPANIEKGVLYSHQGLSYGGVVLSKKIKFPKVLACYKAILQFLATRKIEELILKPIPRIYQKLASDEVDYILFLLKSTLIRRYLTSVIEQQNSILNIQSNRKEGVKKAKKHQLTIREDSDFEVFWNTILIPNLKSRHQATPVHTVEEIEKLAIQFPNNIRQFNVYNKDKIVAGTTVFETNEVAHIQYISSDENRQKLGSLDYLFSTLILEVYKDKKYVDFGISNESQGLKINTGLQYWKECFGARSISHDFYNIKTNNYVFLENVLL